jgi:hypothetical protein
LKPHTSPFGSRCAKCHANTKENAKMNANDEFEAFAERFNRKFHYLPFGKDCGCYPPNVETVLMDLTHTFRELEELKAGVAHSHNSNSTPCIRDRDEGHDYIKKSGDNYCSHCGLKL